MSVTDRFPVGSRCWYLQWNPTRRHYRWQRVQVFAHTASRVGVWLVRDGKVVDEKGSTRYVASFSLTDSAPTEAAREIIQ